jgi:cytidine deaminase
MSTFEELKRRAAKAAVPRSLSESAQCATVGAAPETHRGDIFVGACIDTWSSLGFCAEHAAAAAMLTAGQNEIKRNVAIAALRTATLLAGTRCAATLWPWTLRLICEVTR